MLVLTSLLLSGLQVQSLMALECVPSQAASQKFTAESIRSAVLPINCA